MAEREQPMVHAAEMVAMVKPQVRNSRSSQTRL
jgi:hypothetical protein